jgi:hypothetical protein
MKRPSRMEANMIRFSKIAHVQQRLVQFLGKRLDKIRIRNAFADARRAQVARLFAQQIAPPYDYCRDRMTLSRKDRNVAIGA